MYLAMTFPQRCACLSLANAVALTQVPNAPERRVAVLCILKRQGRLQAGRVCMADSVTWCPNQG